jgi:signal transduction histidine kinase
MMKHLPQRSSPLRLLVFLEWILLGIVAIVQISIAVFNVPSPYLVTNGLGLIIFTLMGLAHGQKWLYTGLEFGLLLILTWVGDLPLLPFLYIVLVIRSCSRFERRDRAIVTILSFIGCLFSQGYRLWSQQMPIKVATSQIGLVWIAFMVIYGLVILFLQLFVDAVLAERARQQQLAQANARLRQYALRVEELATEQERNRIARDIHDSLGHSLTIFNIHLAAALRLLKSEPMEAESLLLEVKQLGAKALQDVRQSVSTLRANPLKDRTLARAIAGLVEDFHRSTGVLPTCKIQIEETGSPELDGTLYRIIQESLTNICKYANATAVDIDLHPRDNVIEVKIKDNGKGFDVTQLPTGFGLQGMQERTLLLGGKLTINAAPDRGCQIRAIFPV